MHGICTELTETSIRYQYIKLINTVENIFDVLSVKKFVLDIVAFYTYSLVNFALPTNKIR